MTEASGTGAIAAGSNEGINSTGANARNTVVRLPAQALRPMAEVDCPAGLRNLPDRAGGLFVGRADAMARLDRALAGTGGVVVQAVHGLGGIGKSTLAAHWAAERAAGFAPVWWITAETPEAIDSGLAALAVVIEPVLAEALALETLRERALQWLTSHEGWLVILDNVTEPADVAPLLGRAGGGCFLITTRRATGWHGLAATVGLDVLTASEAAELLARIVGRTDLDGAEELSAELGWLPLAIEQAGAYLAETGITPRAYLDLLARYPARMFGAAAEGGDAARTIARIWDVTLDRLAGEPLAGQILSILAWYAPDAIPRSLLDGLAEPPALLQALGRLAAYSMVTIDGDRLSVHRLVQAVARTPDPLAPQRTQERVDQARERAIELLAEAIPWTWDIPADWPAWRDLIPHIDALSDHAPADADDRTAARLFNRYGLFLDNQGSILRAIGCSGRALAGYERVLGADHPDTLSSRNNLAYAYEAAGDLGRAVPLFEAALADRVRVLGADHPDTLRSRNNLAGAYQAAGDLGRAVPLYEAALADRVRVLGADHPATLSSRNNLAYAYQAAGDLGRAVPLYEAALADRVRVLGADHPDTLTSRNNLAGAYRAAGDLGRAVPLYEAALAGCERALSPGHPLAETVRANLLAAREDLAD